MGNFIIETKDLTRKFGSQTAVSQLNLTVPKGVVYGFLGPNGAGKTTTIRMILGLVRPTSGEIRVFDKTLSKNRIDILKNVGSLVENPSYYGHLTGRENLRVLSYLLGVTEQRINEVLEIVRLTKAANKKTKGYSLGMKQRLGIAMALLGNPQLLILDEPTNGLDPSGIHEIRELIIEMPRQYGITVLVSSHLLSEMDQMASQVGIINQGELIFNGDIESLRQQSAPRLHFYLDNVERAKQIVNSFGYEAEMHRGRITLASLDYQKSAKLTASFVRDGIDVYRINETKPNLEETFLKLVGKENSL